MGVNQISRQEQAKSQGKQDNAFGGPHDLGLSLFRGRAAEFTSAVRSPQPFVPPGSTRRLAMVLVRCGIAYHPSTLASKNKLDHFAHRTLASGGSRDIVSVGDHLRTGIRDSDGQAALA